MVELAVPSDFMCPISLEVMRDPVTLSTGQTYERRSIEEWFDTGHNTCPSTMQVISRKDVAPNYTLQRLISCWCVSNDYHHGEVVVKAPDIATAKKQAEPRRVKKMLQKIAQGKVGFSNLTQLRSLAKEADEHSYRKVVREAGAIPILANFAFSPENLGVDLPGCEEALGILTLLPLQNIRQHVHIGPKQLTAISWLLNRGSLDARVNAALILGSLAHDGDEMKQSIGATAGVFEGLVHLLKEDLYPRAVDTGLKVVLSIVTGLEKNTVRAVEAGMVFAVAELLPGAERRCQERPLTKLLERLCTCAEGREAVSAHALVVPVLVRIISLRDNVASEHAVSCLWTVCQTAPRKCIDEAAGQAGIFTQLLYLIQTEDSKVTAETRQKATELLRQLRYRLKNCDCRC